jgi:hypothetical protein
VLASLILPGEASGTLISHSGRGGKFWKSVKSLLCSEDNQAFRDRAECWSADLIDAVEFY